jgi:trimethylamine--corrinoid protein Co-methyltransferase
MPSPRISYLSQKEIERIHGKSLDLLQRVGIHYGSEKAIKLLEDAGCEVDRGELSAKIPASLVEKAVGSLPSNFLLAARDPAQDINCGDGNIYYTASGQSLFIRDLKTRKRRPSYSDDLVQCTRLIDALDEIEEQVAMVMPRDVPPIMGGLKCLETSLKYSTKHFLGGGTELEVLPYGRAMIEAVLGDINQLSERPIFSAVINPVSPLQNRGELVDCTLSWAPYRLPIFLQFLPLAGGSAPITLAGTVLQANAEFLGNIVLYQVAQPGWPIIWALAAGSVDMRSGRWAFGPEGALMMVALIDMAKHYGVPCNTWGHSSTEAKAIGFQSGIEGVMPGLLAALAGADNLWGPADMDGANMVDLAYVMLSTEMIRQTDRLLRGMDINDEHFLLEVITKLRFDGEYLADPSTKKYFRDEHLLPKLFPRESYEAWEARGQSEEEMAIEKVREILRSHEPDPLPEDVVREIDRIYASAEKALVQ